MPKAKVTSKGQITIPVSVRRELDLKPGDEIEFVEDRGIFRVRKVLSPSRFDKWTGFLTELAGRRSDDIVREMRGD